jgi:5-methylthioribose kinase
MATLLTCETVGPYAAALDLVSSAAAPVAVEIEGGNLNYAFRVTLSSTTSVFVKQAPGFIKCLGPEYTLASARIAVEVDALRCFATYAGAEFVPAVLHFDEDRAVAVLEDLRDRVLLSEALAESTAAVAEAHGAALGVFAARLHEKSAAGLDELKERFANEEMVGITRAYVLTKPLDASDDTNRHSSALQERVVALRADAAIAAAFERTRALFDGKPEALLHGDLHAGSVMVRRDGAGGVKAIDAEFAFVGPRGVDVGMALAGYCFAWAAALATDRAELAQRLVAALAALWTAYATEGAGAPASVWADSTAFAGCELIRRLIGAAHSPAIDAIADEATRGRAELLALDLGEALLRGDIADLAAMRTSMEAAAGACTQERGDLG